MIVDVDVPIDQTRRHDPAARIEYVGGRGRRNVWLDGADPTPCDGDVGDSIDAGRRVEDAPAPDEEVVARSARQRTPLRRWRREIRGAAARHDSRYEHRRHPPA